MALENIKYNAQELKVQVENMMSDNKDYYKLLAYKTAAKGTAVSIKGAVVGLLTFFIIFSLILAGGFALGEYFGNVAYGFLAIAGIFLLLLLIFLALKKAIVDKPVLSSFSDVFFNKNSYDS